MIVEAGIAPARTTSAITAGTVLISRTGASGGPAASARASSTKRTVPPQASGTNSSKTERSKEMEVAARTPASSSGENVSRPQAHRATALRCSMATALGRPVEPEV